MKTECTAARVSATRCAARWRGWPSRWPTARPPCAEATGKLVSRATGTFLLHRPDPATVPAPPLPPPDPFRVPRSRPRGVPHLPWPPSWQAARLLRLSLGGPPPRPAARPRRPGATVPPAQPALHRPARLQGVAGGRGPAGSAPWSVPADRVPASSTPPCLRRRRAAARPGAARPLDAPAGPAPLGRVEGLGGAWPPPAAVAGSGLLRRPGSGRAAARRGHAARRGGLRLRRDDRSGVTGQRVLLLDDTYVSGARSQSAAAALQLAGAPPR